LFEYGNHYKEVDVLLVPLLQTEFNIYKSPLKLAEAGATNTAVIVSNVEPYKKHLKHGVNCLKVNNQSDWGKYINELNGNKQMIQELAEGLKETCEEHFNWVKVSKQRADLFRQILS
jgi:glycosyltransferase involved in cell wall biosynthesis